MPSRRITPPVADRVRELAERHANWTACDPADEDRAIDKAWGLAAELTMNLLDPADRDAVTGIVRQVFAERRSRARHPGGSAR